jgi:hypothetical protein
MTTPAFRASAPPSVKLGRSVGDEIDGVAVHPDGSVVAVIYDGALHMVGYPSLKKLGVAPESAQAVKYAPDGSVLATVKNEVLTFRDPSTGAIRKQLPAMDNHLHSLAFSPDSRSVVVGAYEAAHVFDVASGRQLFQFAVFDRVVPQIAWSFDGALIAARMCGDAGIFDAKTGKMLAALPDLVSERAALAFLPDGGVLTSIDAKTLGVWARGKWTKPAKRIPTRGLVGAIATSPALVAYADSTTIHVLGPALETIALLKLQTTPAALAASANGSVLVAGAPPALLAWRSKDERSKPKGVPAQALPPDVATLIAGPRKAKLDVPFSKVKWLSKLGKPLPAKTKAKQLESLAKWPGPDHERIGALIEMLETLESELASAAKRAKIRLTTDVYDEVFDLAAKKVPYDEDADWSEPASAAPYMVATIAQLVASYQALHLNPPPDVETLWAWCVDGHWPCGFVREPGDKPVELLVL